MTYANSVGATSVIELDGAAWSENTMVGTWIRPVNPVEQFFLQSGEERWSVAAQIPKNETSVQLVINYVVHQGRLRDADDAISLLASIGWPTLGVGIRLLRSSVRPYKPVYVSLAYELLAQGLITAQIDEDAKRAFLNILKSSPNRAVADTAADALEALD